jgi:hypothetical protein
MEDSEERIAYIISKLRSTLAIYEVIIRNVLRLLVTGNFVPRSPNIVTLMMDEIRSSETLVTSQKTTIFTVTAVKTSNLS